MKLSYTCSEIPDLLALIERGVDGSVAVIRASREQLDARVREYSALPWWRKLFEDSPAGDLWSCERISLRRAWHTFGVLVSLKTTAEFAIATKAALMHITEEEAEIIEHWSKVAK